ncbi:MAG TPA: phage exclusion protein Lit family protein [Flavobacteriales bacterium]
MVIRAQYAEVPFFDPRRGRLPVRCLIDKALDHFHDVSEAFREILVEETSFRELSPNIACAVARGPILYAAQLVPRVDEQGKGFAEIQISETFLQMLWSMGYSMTCSAMLAAVRVRTRDSRPYDISIPRFARMSAVSKAAMELLVVLRPEQHFSLPNPENPEAGDFVAIASSNAIFQSAMTVILMHEVGHQYYRHLDYSPSSVQEEVDADDFALRWLLDAPGSEFDRLAVRRGIIVAYACVLLMDRHLSPSSSHPSPQSRLVRAMELMQLDENDPDWIFASSALTAWVAWYIRGDAFVDLPDSRSLKETFLNSIRRIEALAE